MRCPECSRQFKRTRIDQAWCSVTCNKRAGHRELARARVIYRALYRWRFDRKTSGVDLGFICREIAHWIQEDRDRQRPPPPRHNHSADRGHLRRKSLMSPRLGGETTT